VIAESLDAVIARVTQLGALNGRVGTGQRHSTTDVQRTVSDSYRALSDLLESRGYRVSDDTGALPLPAPDATFPWIEVPWPVGAGKITGLDVNTSGGNPEGWVSLTRIGWERRFAPHHCEQLAFYTSDDPPTVSAAATAAGTVLLLPARDAVAGLYLLHYRPSLGLLTDGTHLFRYPVAAALDWHVADSLWRLVGLRDADAKGRAGPAERMRDRAEAEIPRVARLLEETDSVAVRDWNYRG
jgi:hypothetical protein